MKINSNAWERLARAARHALLEIPEAPPFGFESRVLSRLRRSCRSNYDLVRWRTLLRGAAVASCGIMLLVVAINYWVIQSDGPTEEAFVDSMVTVGFNP